MQSEVHEIDPVTVRVEVEVPWDRVRKGLDATYGKLQKTAKVRGFRPGKVPRHVIRQLFGPQVKSEVMQNVVEQSLFQVLQERELPVVAPPRVDDISDIQDGAPLSFKATVEVRPKIEHIDTALEVVRPRATVTEAQVDAEIERMRERNADIITPDPMRPAKKGDLLTIDYTVEIDAVERPEMAGKGRVIELGANNLLPEFDDELLGKQPGDELQIRVAFGEDAQEELKNKRALFNVKVIELREKILPELDDEFAKDVGDHETLADLRAAVRAQLEKAARERAESAVREQLLEQLARKNPVPVPPSLVAQQEQAMAQELAYFLQLTGSKSGFPADVGARLHTQAEMKVRISMLMSELARQNDLKVEPEEVEARIAQIAEQTGKHIAKVRVEMTGERREGLENRILQDKLLDYLLSRATVTDAPEDAPPAAEDAERGEAG